MDGQRDSDISSLLARCREGDPAVSERLLALLYAELHALAVNCMKGQPPDHTLQATALVNEAYLRVAGSSERGWRDRVHFLAVAARAMRCVLVDRARARGRSKRSPPGERTPLDQVLVTYGERAVDLLALDDALARLAEFDGPMARAVELHFFGGLSMDETAKALGLKKRTFERQWSATRAWLLEEVTTS